MDDITLVLPRSQLIFNTVLSLLTIAVPIFWAGHVADKRGYPLLLGALIGLLLNFLGVALCYALLTPRARESGQEHL